MDKHYIGFCESKTKRSFYFAFFPVVVILILASCSPSKNSYYFKTLKNDTTLSGFVTKELESKIIIGDNLAINISSLSKAEDAVFNIGNTGGSPATIGYAVEKDGTVNIHRLGRVKADGFTRKEFASTLEKLLEPYLKDPIVSVQYLNHKVTIIGDVAKPQVLNMPEEQLSVLDVIVQSGDLNANARRNDIMVIRENGNEKKVKHINLEDHSIFTSPWYYVQPNDVVVVVPDFEKSEREFKRTRLQGNLSIIVSTLTLALIIIDRIFR